MGYIGKDMKNYQTKEMDRRGFLKFLGGVGVGLAGSFGAYKALDKYEELADRMRYEIRNPEAITEISDTSVYKWGSRKLTAQEARSLWEPVNKQAQKLGAHPHEMLGAIRKKYKEIYKKDMNLKDISEFDEIPFPVKKIK